jgi:hypothetical protein
MQRRELKRKNIMIKNQIAMEVVEVALCLVH